MQSIHNNMIQKRNIFLTLSYDGTNYHGFQIQKNAITVQEIFQNALKTVLKYIPEIKGCSRTDSGVHANMYGISFKTYSKIDCQNLIFALNRNLPGDISVNFCKDVDENFHARYSCVAKEYVYKILNSKIKNPFLDKYALHYWYPIDVDRLNKAARYFIGKHDFTSFATIDKSREASNMVRTIQDLTITKEEELINIKIKADGFLYNMVRIIVGTLLRVAQGKIDPEDISKIIAEKNRALAGPTAPAHGLYLNKIFY
ncbi:MAG: tRNA pseudouridine(38-40) synthase TruA [Acutalibacteraceae bacterium]